MRRFRNRQHFGGMPLKECGYSLPHMERNDPNSPNAPSPKHSPKSDRSSKVGMATVMSRPANNGRLPSQSALGVADESGIVENHADGRARSIDKKASNCRARRSLTPIIGNKSLTLNALWNPCAGLT